MRRAAHTQDHAHVVGTVHPGTWAAHNMDTGSHASEICPSALACILAANSTDASIVFYCLIPNEKLKEDNLRHITTIDPKH